MKPYISEKEIGLYCTMIAGVEKEHIESATVLIDAYKGRSFYPKTFTETVRLTKKRNGEPTRGKLKHLPRCEIKKVKCRVVSAFGIQEIELFNDCIIFDSDDSEYFTFIMPRQLMFQKEPTSIIVEYTSGFVEVPADIKRATALLAQNLRQMGGALPWYSRDDYDIKVTLAANSLFSKEIKMIVNSVRLT